MISSFGDRGMQGVFAERTFENQRHGKTEDLPLRRTRKVG